MMRPSPSIRNAARALCGAAALALGACASAPVHYYTLVAPLAPSTDTAMHADDVPESFQLVMGAVPADVDEPQLVVRESGERAAILDGERWVAPLQDEIRAALSAELARELPGIDVTGLAAAAKARLVVKVEVRRFESVPGGYALLEASWSLMRAGDADEGKAAKLLCSSTLREPVGVGYPELVRGHQRAVRRLGEAIATTGRALRGGSTPNCPAPRS